MVKIVLRKPRPTTTTTIRPSTQDPGYNYPEPQKPLKVTRPDQKKPLPPCPLPLDNADAAIDLRNDIPGIDCNPLPPCPTEAELDIRNQDNGFIPGVTCQELPPCKGQEAIDIDLRTGLDDDITEEIPGVNCRRLSLLDENFQVDFETLRKSCPILQLITLTTVRTRPRGRLLTRLRMLMTP